MSRKKPPVIEPPPHLSERSQQLWRDIVPRRASSPERLTMLRTALECLDRADEAARVIATEGMTSKTETTGAIHVHPLVRIEKESRLTFIRCWDLLGLQWCSETDGRFG